MSAIELVISAVLTERARRQPDAPAYTFIDYDVEPAGHPRRLTWSQVHHRAQVVAAELASCGSPGDRVAILAAQGFEYIVGFLGAVQAGFITTSGKVRRSTCAEQYRLDQFTRLDVAA